MVEVLIVSAVVSIVTRIAIPNVNHVRTRARAAEIYGDLRAVEMAAHELEVDYQDWPEDAEPGVVPPELAKYLGQGFSFVKEGYRLDWENWYLPGGLPGSPETTRLVGVSVVPESEALADALRPRLQGSAWFVVGNDFTYVIQRP